MWGTVGGLKAKRHGEGLGISGVCGSGALVPRGWALGGSWGLLGAMGWSGGGVRRGAQGVQGPGGPVGWGWGSMGYGGAL